MSRYVEAETLVRWICGNKCGCKRDECGYDIPCQQVQLLEGAPSIDIVRCKECIHCADDYIDVGMGTMPQFTCELGRCGESVQPNDFCPYGEREGE